MSFKKRLLVTIAFLAVLFIANAVDASSQENNSTNPVSSEQKLHGGLLEIALKAKQAKGIEKENVLVLIDSEQKIGFVNEKLKEFGSKKNSVQKIGKTIITEIPIANLLEAVDINGVTGIWPDFEVTALDEGALTQIKAREAWQYGFTGTGIKIAVLDTGIDSSHPSLQGKIIASTNFSDSSTVSDIQGHGTHVAGIIAGYGDANGVAPNAFLLNAKVLNDSGSGTASSVISGINWAVANGAQIINLSLGTTSHETNTPLNQAVRDAIAQGVIVIIASGNCGECGNCNGFSGVTNPGNTKEAITVGAVDSSNAHACFSSGENLADGIKPDIVAPGVGIISSIPNNSLGTKSGTSMATPFVAGSVALLLQKYAWLTPYQAKKWIELNSLDLGETGKDSLFGFGLIDSFKIVSQEFSGIPDENAIIPPDKNVIDFNVEGTSFSFSGPNVLNKKQEGLFRVETGTTGNSLSINEVSTEKDVTIEFSVFDEFGNIVDSRAIGPKYMTDFVPEVFEYLWKSNRVGNFTIKATAFVEGTEVNVFSSTENVKTATAEKSIKITVPNDSLIINEFNAPETIQKGSNTNFSLNVLANNLLLSGSSLDNEYLFRAPIKICATIDLHSGDLVWLKKIVFSNMQVLANLNDARIFDFSTNTELPRIAEGSNASTDGNIFFNLTNPIPASTCSENNYYLYWGNSNAGAPDSSNVASKENFESYANGTILPYGRIEWASVFGNARGVISSDNKKNGSKAMFLTADSGKVSYATLSFKNFIPNFDFNHGNRIWDYNSWIYLSSADSEAFVYLMSKAPSTIARIDFDNGTISDWENILASIDANTWYKVQITYAWNSNTHKTCIYKGTDTALVNCLENARSPTSGIPGAIELDAGAAGSNSYNWFDDIGFFAPYETNVSLGETESLGRPEPKTTDINAFVSVFIKDDSNSIVAFAGSEEKNILQDANNMFELQEPIDLPGGSYNLEAIVFFEDQNISIKKPLQISVEGFATIDAINAPAEAEINSIIPISIRVKNNSNLEINPIVLLQIKDSEANELIASIIDLNKQISANSIQNFLFDWNASVKAKNYEVNAIVILDNSSQSASQQIQIIDSLAPEIQSIEFSATAKQKNFNPIKIIAVDSSQIASAKAIATAPSGTQEQTELTKNSSTGNEYSFTGAFSGLSQTGNYSFTITICDEFNNCIQSQTQNFTVIPPDSNCTGKNILAVIDNDAFSLQNSSSEWIKQLNSLNSQYCFSQWETKKLGNPNLALLKNFDAIIWSTGNNFGYAIDSNDATTLESIASTGAKLLIEGSDIASEHAFDSFAENILHATLNQEFILDENSSTRIILKPNEIIQGINEIDLNKEITAYPDALDINTSISTGIADWNSNAKTAINAFQDSNSKIIFFAFSIDSIQDKNKANKIVSDSINWLFKKATPTNSAPKVTITYPYFSGYAFNGKSVYMRFNAVDAENKQPLTATIYLSNSNNPDANKILIVKDLNLFSSICSGTDFNKGKSCTYSKYFSTKIAPDGIYYYYVIVNDGEKTGMDFTDYPIRIDSIPPATTLSQNNNTITLTCTDANSGCNSINYRAFADKNIQDSSLLAYYKFDNDYGSTIKDSSAKGNNGLLKGSYSYSTYSINGKSLYFDANKFVEVPCLDNGFCDFAAQDFSIQAWIRTSDSNSVIISAGNASSYYQLYFENGKPTFEFNTGDGIAKAQSSTKYNNYNWYHLTATRTGRTAKLYINGTLVASNISTGTMNSIDITTNLFIGKRFDNTKKFRGYLDEIAVYKKELSAIEAKQSYGREKYGLWQYKYLYNTNTTSFDLNASGNYMTQYYSSDKANNYETTKTTSIIIK